MIYSLVNQKGGVSKTTTAAALWTGLNSRGKKTLAVDLDPQGNLTYYAGASSEGKTVLGLLTKEADAIEAIQHTDKGDFIASNSVLSGADTFIIETGKEYRLKEALAPIVQNYDYIIIDTPPELGILTVNALTACDRVIIPAQADVFSLQGIERLSHTIRMVKTYCNHDLTISGLLLTRYNSRTLLAQSIASDMSAISEKLGAKLFNATIREGVAVRESQLKQKCLFEYAPTAKVTADYEDFLDELLLTEKA